MRDMHAGNPKSFFIDAVIAFIVGNIEYIIML